MKGAWDRLALTCVALVCATVMAAGGTAGNRAALVTFEAFPGPGQVTYGELIAYRATFENTSGSTLTKVRFRQRYPVAGTASASPVSSTCPTTPTNTSTQAGQEWVCDFGTVAANAAPLALTIVWQVPTLASPENCPDCLTTNGRFTVKEGLNDVSDPNDAFPPGGYTVTATLLAAGSGATETLKAGGYETASTSCASPSASGNLRTNPAVGLTNPVTTTVCLPPFSVSATDLGHATTITELAGNPRRSEVCVAKLGTNCGASYIDANFAPDYVTHVFRVAEAALEKNEKITQVSHNGFPLSACPNMDPNGCVVSIALDKKTKTWTIVAKSFTNGFWSWP